MRDLRLVLPAGALAAILVASGCAPREEGPVRVEPQIEVEVLRPLQIVDNAVFPEEDSELLSVEVFEDRVVFTYSPGGSPDTDFETDQVISGTDDGGYLRRVVGVTETSPGVFEVRTVHADLAELILDGHFVVHMRPGTEGFVQVDEGAVTTAGLEGGWSLLTPEFRNISCGGGSGGGVTVDPSFDIDVGAEVEVDITWRRTWLVIPRGDLQYARFVLSGDIEAGISVNTTSNTSFMCSYNLVEYLRGRGVMVPKREWATTFAVGPVPVVITHTIQPSLSVSVSGSIETGNTTARASGRIGLRAGTEYTDATGWRTVWEPSRSGSAGLEAADPGALSIGFSASGGIGYQAKLYDALGPGASIGPSVGATFRVEADRCRWNAEVKAGVGMTLSGSLTIPVFDYTLAEISLSQTLAEATIANPMGTFPWSTCQDAGMMSTPDAGSPPPPPPPGDGGTVLPGQDGGPTPAGDGGGMGTSDGGTPDCSSSPNCGSCTAISGCEWCPGTSSCTDSGSCGGAITSMSACPACGVRSATCVADADCCMGFVCSAGGCREEALCALREAASCTARADCCPGLECRPETTGGATSCCLGGGYRCDADSDCCGQMACTDGRCACRPRGSSCATSIECCGSAVCTGGTCT